MYVVYINGELKHEDRFLGRALRHVREAAKMDIAAMAKKIGLKYGDVFQLEKSRYEEVSPWTDTWSKAAMAVDRNIQINVVAIWSEGEPVDYVADGTEIPLKGSRKQ